MSKKPLDFDPPDICRDCGEERDLCECDLEDDTIFASDASDETHSPEDDDDKPEDYGKDAWVNV